MIAMMMRRGREREKERKDLPLKRVYDWYEEEGVLMKEVLQLMLLCQEQWQKQEKES